MKPTTLLTLVITGGITVGFLFGVTVGKSVYGQDKSRPGVLTELEKNILMRTELQLQDLQKKFQEQAKPVVDEQQAILKRKCDEIQAVVGTDCEVNVQTGTVVKKPPKPPEKK